MRTMQRTMMFVVLLMAFSACASAQTFTGFAWDQQAATPTEAQAQVYRVYFDASATGLPLTNVLCAGPASPFTCSAVNVVPMGHHTAALTAALSDGSAESQPSDAVTFVQGPPKPTNVQPKK